MLKHKNISQTDSLKSFTIFYDIFQTPTISLIYDHLFMGYNDEAFSCDINDDSDSLLKIELIKNLIIRFPDYSLKIMINKQHDYSKENFNRKIFLISLS